MEPNREAYHIDLLEPDIWLICVSRFKDSQTSILNNDPYVIHENGTLEIHGAQPLNSGKYTCIASNNLGTKENHVYLEVKGETRANQSQGHPTPRHKHPIGFQLGMC